MVSRSVGGSHPGLQPVLRKGFDRPARWVAHQTCVVALLLLMGCWWDAPVSQLSLGPAPVILWVCLVPTGTCTEGLFGITPSDGHSGKEGVPSGT
jgi:hypothetical protein